MLLSTSRAFLGIVHPAGRSIRCFKGPLSNVPMPRNNMATAQDFLIAIGRGLDKRIPVEKWVDLFRMKRDHFKKLGVGVRDRRYVMWAMEKYRFGAEPRDFAHEIAPKKKYRGRGPRIQNGKRIR
ncbi:hypothetical protein BS47DRAFT_1332989 [Hydnum rufescens UP504]|uniref:Small ribosomal subunit protein mS41 n=1 Tax=Hydnum rufescens UP504 TaxID=1448309 RepID=A0A9P6DMI1_9AGAM|nr:hypothetical protein BS47DRAFT_1332989 [Hydnum rufescens UP504]